MDPYYVQMQLPGETAQEFVLLRPFVPRSSDDSRQQLEAFMVAQTDEQGQSRIVAYTVPGLKVDGPVIANRSMLADPEVAETTTLLGQRGSGGKLGNMLLVPLDGGDNEDALLYLRPLYVEASGSQPAVQQVIAAYGESVRICSTVELVLGALLLPENQVGDNCENVTPVSLSGISSPPASQSQTESPSQPETPDEGSDEDTPETQEPEETSTTDQVQHLLSQAQEAFLAANEALEEGNLGEYQDLINQGQSYVDQANDLLRGQ